MQELNFVQATQVAGGMDLPYSYSELKTCRDVIAMNTCCIAVPVLSAVASYLITDNLILTASIVPISYFVGYEVGKTLVFEYFPVWDEA